jgi:hypothetical protein
MKARGGPSESSEFRGLLITVSFSRKFLSNEVI